MIFCKIHLDIDKLSTPPPKKKMVQVPRFGVVNRVSVLQIMFQFQ